MKSKLRLLLATTELVASLMMSYAVFLFLRQTAPIIKSFGLVAFLMTLLCILLVAAAIFNMVNPYRKFKEFNFNVKEKYILIGLLTLGSGLYVYTFLNTAVTDFFQPFSIHDDQIYMTLYAVLIYLGINVINVVRLVLNKVKYHGVCLFNIILLLMLSTLFIWGTTQMHYEYENAEIVNHLFEANDEYASYRIPSLLVIPKGSTLANGEYLEDDYIVVFNESRVHSSHDNGDIDMGMRRSYDAGETWTDVEYVVDLGTDKIGNATPVYDAETGIIHMVHLRNFYSGSEPRGAYVMQSEDGGLTWSEAELIYEKSGIGPGHGIQIKGGDYDGRLVVPGYSGGGLVYYSDDSGVTWEISERVSLDSNETEVAQLDENTLIMTTRENTGMALPHDDVFKYFAYSYDGGVTWTEPFMNETVITPICMSGLGVYEGVVYYTGPQEHQSRSNLYLLSSTDGGVTFEEGVRIYEGPAGYSDMGILSDGSIVVLFENGAVEYDERLTFVKINNPIY